MSAPPSLQPLRLPLYGRSLIEASAGTGKTYTLALLYLRLILGHGRSAAFARPLDPPEILVLTFTNAAAEELRARIRTRLLEMAALLNAEVPEGRADPLLLELRAEIPGAEQARAARRLSLAAEWMDEAAISTIHAWCYRLLREHALIDWGPDGPQLLDEQTPLIQQAAEDYWRTFVLGLAPGPLQTLLRQWRGPHDLAEAVAKLLAFSDEELPAADDPWSLLERRYQLLTELKDRWRSQGYIAALKSLFEQAASANEFHKQALRSNQREAVLKGLTDWLNDPDQERPAILANEGWRRMSSLGVRAIWRDPSRAPVDHPACRALAELKGLLDGLMDPNPHLIAHAVRWIRGRVEREKRRRGLIAQQDLLALLAQALTGPRGKALAAAIRNQFPAALVDEFQDTDPLQYRIFDAIYDLKANDQRTAFIMVGDPKQAIYAFRGADIHVYLQARAATQGPQATLTVNYRSSPELIAAVNAFFDQGNERPAGPFLFGEAIPFWPAQAGLKGNWGLWIAGRPCPPLQAWIIEPPAGRSSLARGDYLTRSAEMAAGLIAELICFGRGGGALLLADGKSRPLQPSDIAILVRGRDEAAAIKKALRPYGIACTYLSERTSVFATETAKGLLTVLRAIADPSDEGLMRQALVTRLLGRSLADLDRLNRDEQLWEREWERLGDLNLRWRRQGVLPMLYRLISEFGIAARLLAQPDGERQLTDLLHLGELLQAASLELDGEQALIRFLEDSIQEAERFDAAEDRQLRLESDEQLVRVITIHKAKGLEYPLVFLPFAASLAPESRPVGVWVTHDEDHRRRLHLVADESILAEVRREQLSEELRKLYVALTRACHALWMGLGPVKGLEQSAVNYLLGIEQPTAEGLRAALNRLPGLKLVDDRRPVSVPILGVYPGEPAASPPLPARKLIRWRWRPWRISSYSALCVGLEGSAGLGAAERLPEIQAGATAGSGPETPADEIAREEPIESSAGLICETKPERSLHAFPRGGRFGTFLHRLIEWAARLGGGFAEALADQQARLQMLSQRCAYLRLNGWVDLLDEWLADLCDRPWSLAGLGAPPLRLADLRPQGYQAELEFWLEVQGLDLKGLDRLISQQTLSGRPRPPLTGELLNGMLKGFIDLAFEHQGRYYVLDWKSNWLGPDDLAYTQEAMSGAILRHRYDLQYALYLLALHRQLQARLPGYDYDRHLGGAIYVFLRGSQAAGQGLFMERPPRTLIETLDRMFGGNGHR